MMIAIPSNSANLRVFCYDGNGLKEESFIMNEDEFEYVNFLFCGKKIEVLQEIPSSD